MANLAQLEEALRRADAAGDAESATVLAGEYAKMRAETYKPEPASFGKRLAMGVAEPFVGTAHFMKRGAEAMAEVPGSNMLPFGIGPAMTAIRATGSAEDYQGTVDQLKAAQDLAAPEGMDWGRMAGNVIGLAPTLVAGGVPATIGGVARAGALTGAASGLAMPVAGGENYAGDKASQIAVGGIAGAVAGPIAQKGLQGLGNLSSSIAAAVRRAVAPTANPQQIQITIQQTLQNAGIDPASLPRAFLDDVTRQVRDARAAGGTLDQTALVNRATLESVGIPGTRGQITQDPSQYSRELFLREAPGGEDLATQYRNSIQTLNQRLNDVQAGAAPPLRPVETGRQALNVLAQADNRGDALVSALYGAARGTAGIDTEINGRALAKTVSDRLSQERVSKSLPADYWNFLNEHGAGKALTIGNVAEEVQRINGLMKTYGGKPEGVALNILKRELNTAAERSGSQTGEPAAQAFVTAKRAAAQRFGLHEAIPALRAAAQGEVAPDDFMRKFIYGAKQDELRQLSTFVRQASPQTWQQIRGQVLGDLQLAANPSGQANDFSQAAFNKQLRSLDQAGKLDLIFTPQEIQTLRAVGRAGELVQKGPPGVSRTGLSGAAKAAGLLSRAVGAIPGLGSIGGVAQAAAQRGGNVLQANVATSAPPMAQIPYRNAIPAELQNRLATLAGPGAILPLFQGGGN